MEKRTTIFSIFVFLCLLTNSTYARTTEYENPKDTILDMMLYFDLKARQADKVTKETVKRWQHWIPCLPILPAADIFIPLFWFHRIHITEKEPDIAPGLKEARK